MADQQFLKSLFAGEDIAFRRFYKESRGLFMGYFAKAHPASVVPIVDIYQDSVIILWSKIVDGEITEESFKTLNALKSYLIEIGKNKYHEKYRQLEKESRLKKGNLFFKKSNAVNYDLKKMNKDELEDLLLFEPGKSGKTTEDLRELAKEKFDTPLNEILISLRLKKEKNSLYYDSNNYKELFNEWCEFLKVKYNDLGEPCSTLLRYTWYYDMNDNEILEAFNNRFANKNSLKAKRYKCHRELKKMFNDWQAVR